MLEKLCDLIADVPGVASTPTARKLIAQHLIESGVVLLICPGSQVSVKFNPDECVGMMSVGCEEFHVYVACEKAEQCGCFDASTLAGVKTTPSVVKRVFTIVEV